MKLFRTIRRRLWLKILIPVTLIVCLVIGASVLFNGVFQERCSLGQMDQQNIALTQVIESSMFDSLSTGDNDVVRRQFQRINDALPDLMILVYDFNGRITFSTQKTEIGKSIDSFLMPEARAGMSAMLETGAAFQGQNRTQINGINFVFDSREIRNEAQCHHCHGSSRQILGGITVFSPSDAILRQISKGKQINWLTGVAGLILIVVFVWAFFHFSVNIKVRQILAVMAKMRQGDFTQEIVIPEGDEMNHILARIGIVNTDLRQVLAQVQQGSERILTSSRELSTISDSLAQASSATSSRAETVSASAEEMRITNRTIADSMEQSAGSVSSVASAVEEMAATVAEIVKNVNTSMDLAHQVAEDFNRVEQAVGTLGVNADEVDTVTDEIRSISEQVSMLALNAKIEAARAGEAGKGFAVVAEEITALALDTSRATIEADEKLMRMKQMTRETISLVQDMARLVQDSVTAMTTISASVEEQNATTSEIARSVGSVSEDVMVVNANVGQSVEVAGEIAQNISTVEHDSQKVKQSSDRLNEHAKDLSAMADDFEKLLSRFKV